MLRLLSVIVLSTLVLACNGRIELFNYTDSVDPILVEGSGIIGGLFEALGQDIAADVDFTIASSARQQGQLIEITLADIGFRTVLQGPDDRSDASLQDDTLLTQCREGQLPISWIHAMTMDVQVQDDAATRTEVATYTLPEADRGSDTICGFSLTTDESVNLNDFLPDFEIITSVEGTQPTQDTEIGGFYQLTASVRVGG